MNIQNKPAYINNLKELVNRTVYKDKEWYRKSSQLRYFAYRISGIMLILLSSSLPLLTANSFQYKEIIISLIGVLIAVISSLISFFKWNDIWKADSFAFVELKNALAIWEMKMMNAETENTEGAVVEMSKMATLELFNFLQNIDTENSRKYFKILNEFTANS